ncbi:MAG: hypothetical protein R3E58_09870 [Phycisphaerae bacterium]
MSATVRRLYTMPTHWSFFTDWQEFRTPDFNMIKERSLSPVIFDGCNLYNRHSLGQARV